MVFRDREEAAERLAVKLARYRGDHPLILAVPRGAVPMGRLLAEALDGDLDVVLVRKLGAPGNPELAVGSVSEDGEVWIADYAREMGVPRDYLDEEARRQLAVLRERRHSYSPGGEAERPDPKGRTVIVVDDGVATGSTLLAALRWVRGRRPKRLVAAVAVAPPETLRKIAAVADEVVCLLEEELFFAVGQFFLDFRQVTDEEVKALLGEHRRQRVSPGFAMS